MRYLAFSVVVASSSRLRDLIVASVTLGMMAFAGLSEVQMLHRSQFENQGTRERTEYCRAYQIFSPLILI